MVLYLCNFGGQGASVLAAQYHQNGVLEASEMCNVRPMGPMAVVRLGFQDW